MKIWKVIKSDPERVKTIMNTSLQITANLTIVLDPFLPFSMEKLRGFLNIEKLSWKQLGRTDLLNPGHKVNKPELLFEKIEDDTIQKQVNKLLETKKTNQMESFETKPAKEYIDYDYFAKLDIRIGTIVIAEKVAKTKKLLKLTIEIGNDTRTVVSGIAEYYEPEQVIGKQVAILVNLAPKNLRGIESQGMILMAENSDGSLAFVSPAVKTQNGSQVK
jgi:methionyl-tRNA synthetase